jgi:hypothetical protein
MKSLQPADYERDEGSSGKGEEELLMNVIKIVMNSFIG